MFGSAGLRQFHRSANGLISPCFTLRAAFAALFFWLSVCTSSRSHQKPVPKAIFRGLALSQDLFHFKKIEGVYRFLWVLTFH